MLYLQKRKSFKNDLKTFKITVRVFCQNGRVQVHKFTKFFVKDITLAYPLQLLLIVLPYPVPSFSVNQINDRTPILY